MCLRRRRCRRSRAIARRSCSRSTTCIDNAMRHADATHIELQARLGDKAVEFVVSDRGRGIPEDELKRVQQPFVRGEPTAAAAASAWPSSAASPPPIAAGSGSKAASTWVRPRHSRFRWPLHERRSEAHPHRRGRRGDRAGPLGQPHESTASTSGGRRPRTTRWSNPSRSGRTWFCWT